MKKLSKKQKIIIGIIAAIVVATIIGVIFFKYSFTGVAAIVNGQTIKEDEVTEEVQKARAASGLEDDSTWYSYLKQNNLKTSDIRNNILDELIVKEATKQIAEQHEIEVTDAEVQEQYNQLKSSYTDEEWKETVTQSGRTEEEIREQCEEYALSEKVSNTLAEQENYPQELYTEFFSTYGTKINGSTGYYQMCFPDGQEAKAQEMYNKVKNNEISFEDAVKQVTEADNSGLNFNYVIYDCFIQNAQELTDAINNTPVGEISGLVKTQGYTFIVKVVDKASCPDLVTSFDQLDEPTREYVQNYANELIKISYGQNAVQYEMKNMDIHVFEMPFKTPYSKSIFG